MENVGQPVPDQARPLRYVVVGDSLVGLSAAIALSRLGAEVTVAERSPARVIDGGGLGVDVALLREVTGIGMDPPVLHGRAEEKTPARDHGKDYHEMLQAADRLDHYAHQLRRLHDGEFGDRWRHESREDTRG